MTPFKQLIRPGQSGTDVLAVKRAMKKMGVAGSEKLVVQNQDGLEAGDLFVHCVNRVLSNHGEKADNTYGPKAHEIIAPHFDAYGVRLYSTAHIRHVPIKPPTNLTAQKAAQRLLELAAKGRYHADNPGDMRDVRAAAAGEAVWSGALRKHVHIDFRPLDLLVWLIDAHNFKIGTFAICSDHFRYDGPNGHNGGFAVDISSINGTSVASRSGRSRTLSVAKLIHGAQGVLKPWQLICDGYGGIHDNEIGSLCLPSRGIYDYATLAGHRDHIHVGYHS